MTIQKVFGLEQVQARHSKPGGGPDPTLLMGLELEIENATTDWALDSCMDVHEDGSLRNGGLEFILRPMHYTTVIEVLEEFYGGMDVRTDHPAHFSERTSVHVHTNCQDLTIDQLSTILLLYQVFEGLLFRWVGQDRDKNIFCVPWSQTVLTHSVMDNIERYIKLTSVERNKYTALNLVPLKSLGTLEWRHMHGTNNVEKLINWLTIISHFFRVARSVPFNEIKERLIRLNNNSEYEQIIDFVFQDSAILLRGFDYRYLLEDGVLNMKYSLAPKEKSTLDMYMEQIEQLHATRAEAQQRFAIHPQLVTARPTANPVEF